MAFAATLKYPVANDTSAGTIQNELDYIRLGVTPMFLVNLGKTSTPEKEEGVQVTCVRPMPNTEGMVAMDGGETGAAAGQFGSMMGGWQIVGLVVGFGAVFLF